MGIFRGAHGSQWGDLLCRSGGLHPGDAIKRLKAAWETWRQICVPRWLQSMVERAHQPPVPPPRRGTYGNAAVAHAARNVEAPAQYWSSSNTPSRPGELDPSTLPWRYRYSSSSSASILTKPRPQDTARAVSCGHQGPTHQAPGKTLWPSGRRNVTQPVPQQHPDSTGKKTQGTTTADQGSPAPPTEKETVPHQTTTATHPDTGARPEEPHGTTRPQPTASPSPTRNRRPRTPTSDHVHLLPTPTRADMEPQAHRGSPARLTAPVPTSSPPTQASTSAPAPAQAITPNTDAPAGTPRYGPHPTLPQPRGPTMAQTLAGARLQAATAGPAGVTVTDRTQATANTAGHAPPEPRNPGTHPEAPTARNRYAPPTQRGSSTEDAGARRQRTTVIEGPGSRRTEQMAVKSAKLATIPAVHLAAHVPPAAPSDTSTHHSPAGRTPARDRATCGLRNSGGPPARHR